MNLEKRGQVTIFIILGILIVGGIIGYFIFSGGIGATSIPEDLRPAYDFYLSCAEDAIQRGVVIMGSRGGYIDLPEFEPGSVFMPQGSQLSFMGQGIPYWMYVSGNNIVKDQVPSVVDMEGQLGDFIVEEIGKCDFSGFEEQGYDIYFDEASVEVEIEDEQVKASISQDLFLYLGESRVSVSSHDVSVNSKLGKFYNKALEVYNFERSDVFLEKYALDVMRLYGPVDGVEMTCNAQVFNDADIREDIARGLETNIAMIKLNGDYYDLNEDDRGYFVVDELESEENVNFVYSSSWPTRIERYGDNVVSPVGIQEGLGILGFCYVPYHFVYDINFPVMIQFFDDGNLFQFPVVAVIDKNQAREAMSAKGVASLESEMCQYKNQMMDIYTYNLALNPVEARIQFKCLDEVCDIGITEIASGGAYMREEFPQCLNGFIVASAEGYADAKYKISTNEESVANVVMKKKYEVGLDLGSGVDSAMVSFNGVDYSTTVVYPDTQVVELVEDYYNVTVYVYEDSNLKFAEVNRRECVDVAADGLLGFLGQTKEECYDINISAFDIENAVIGGGVSTNYIMEGDLMNAVELNVNVPLFDTPANLDDLQKNYELAASERVYLTFE